MQGLIDKFNEVLGKDFYIHNVNNTEVVSKSICEGVFKTNGGSLSVGANNGYINQVLDTTITFAVQCDDRTVRDNLINQINAFITSTNNQEYNIEDDNYHYFVSWQSFNDNGQIYALGIDKMVNVTVSGQIAITNALLTSNGLEIKLKTALTASEKALSGVIEFTPSMSIDMSSDINISNSNKKYNYNSSSLSIRIKGYLLNDEANAILASAFSNPQLPFYLSAKWEKNSTTILNLSNKKMRFASYSPVFVNNNYVVYETILVEDK